MENVMKTLAVDWESPSRPRGYLGPDWKTEKTLLAAVFAQAPLLINPGLTVEFHGL